MSLIIARNNDGGDVCKHCGSREFTRKVNIPSANSKHYGKLICNRCGGFHSHIIDPSDEWQFSLTKGFVRLLCLKFSHVMSQDEKIFLENIYDEVVLSDEAKGLLNIISEKYLGRWICLPKFIIQKYKLAPSKSS